VLRELLYDGGHLLVLRSHPPVSGRQRPRPRARAARAWLRR
jgi:hypothetical protein